MVVVAERRDVRPHAADPHRLPHRAKVGHLQAAVARKGQDSALGVRHCVDEVRVGRVVIEGDLVAPRVFDAGAVEEVLRRVDVVIKGPDDTVLVRQREVWGGAASWPSATASQPSGMK